MKRIRPLGLALAILASGLVFNAFASPRPGEVNFGNLGEPDRGAKYVEINVGPNLIALAARLLEKPRPEAAKLLRSVQLVRVNVVGLGDGNRAETEKRVRSLRGQLNQQGWERVVTVQEPGGEDVGVFIKARGEEALEGIVVTVLDPRKQEAVFVNIVGDLKPEQISALGEALNLDPLKQLGGLEKK